MAKHDRKWQGLDKRDVVMPIDWVGPYGNEDRAAIEKVVRETIGDRPDVVLDIEAAARRFIGRRAAPSENHRLRDAAALRDIAYSAEALVVKLGNLSMNADVELRRMNFDIEQATEQVADIMGATAYTAARISESMPDQTPKRGRPVQWGRAAFLRELGGIYEIATGRRASISTSGLTAEPTGRFFTFLKTCASPILGMSDQSLRTAFKRARP